MGNGFTAALVDGTIVNIVEKRPNQARGIILVDDEGQEYVQADGSDYITPLEVAEAVEEVASEEVPAEEPQPDLSQTISEPTEDEVAAGQAPAQNSTPGPEEESAS